jgi:hypothetical protein
LKWICSSHKAGITKSSSFILRSVGL